MKTETLRFTVESVDPHLSIAQALEADAEVIIRGPARTVLGVFESGLVRHAVVECDA